MEKWIKYIYIDVFIHGSKRSVLTIYVPLFSSLEDLDKSQNIIIVDIPREPQITTIQLIIIKMLFNRIISPRVITPISRSILYRPQLKLFMSTEIRKAIEDAIASAPVVLFMKGTPEFPQCGFSRATVALLGKQGVDPAKFAAYNVLEDPELREAIKEFSNWPTIPQLYVNKEFIGGCDVLTSMASSGELAELLEEADALVPEEAEEDLQTEQEQNHNSNKKN